MRHTLAEIRDLVKRFVDSGSCRDSVIDARVNEALERLMDGEDWECLRRVVRITITGNTFYLPPEIAKVMWVAIEGTPSKIFGMPYQFLSSGVGDLDYRNTGSRFTDVMDLGDRWPIMFAIPESCGDTKLFAVSTEAADAGIDESVVFAGRKEDNTAVLGGYRMPLAVNEVPDGFDLTAWSGVWTGALATALTLSSESLAHIDRVTKIPTVGVVHLYAVDEANSKFYKLAFYAPSETRPEFRRYRITNTSKCSTGTTSALALVRLRFAPLVLPTDEVPIDSIQAIKLMVMAIREENAGQLQNAVNYETQAKRILTEREKTRTMSDGTPVIFNSEYRTSLGRHMNRGTIL